VVRAASLALLGACAAPAGVEAPTPSHGAGTTTEVPAVEDCVRVGATLAVEGDLAAEWDIPARAGSLPTGETWAVRGQVLRLVADDIGVGRDADGRHHVTVAARVGVNASDSPFHMDLTAAERPDLALGCDAYVAWEPLMLSYALDVRSEGGSADAIVTASPLVSPFGIPDVRGLTGCALDEAAALSAVASALRAGALAPVLPALEDVNDTLAETLRSRVGIMCSARR
jgi:hypothetical protein